jgi:predicted tellurium resistance membrane protein TerC
MAELFTVENLITLMVLTALETVLGFDNLLYISIEAKRVAKEKQKYVRQVGIVLAIALRIVLLFVVLQMIAAFQSSLFTLDLPFIHADVNGHALIVLLGGVFLMYTALKEIFHMLVVHDLHGENGKGRATRTVASALTWIVLMNIVFSFDTVLSAIALTKVFWVMATAIVLSGILMVVMAESVARFLERNRMYEVLGLFVLLLVGILLMTEGGHLAHLKFFGYEIEAMSKATFYFVLVTLVLVDIVQGRYQKKIMLEQRQKQLAERAARDAAAAAGQGG